MYKLLVVIIFFTLQACSVSIDRSQEISNFSFDIGVTTKSAVIENLGLPDSFARNSDNEILGYKGKADGTDFFIPMPVAAQQTSPTTMQVYYTDIGPSKRRELDAMDLILIFNKNGILIEAKKGSEE